MMLKKLKSKKGVTLIELLVTLVVTSVFFTMVGTIVFTYRGVTNAALTQAQETSTTSLIFSTYEKFVNQMNKDESLGNANLELVETKTIDNSGKNKYTVDEATLTSEKKLANGNPYAIITYSRETKNLVYKVDGEILLEISVEGVDFIHFDTTSDKLLEITTTKEVEKKGEDYNIGETSEIIINQKSFFFIRTLLINSVVNETN